MTILAVLFSLALLASTVISSRKHPLIKDNTSLFNYIGE